MLTKNTKLRLVHAVTDQKVADEIEKRLILYTPANPSDSENILNSLNRSLDKSISERLIIALAGDDQGAAGRELAHKLNAMVEVLRVHAEGGDIAAAKALMGSEKLSSQAKLCLVHALADQKAADEFEAEYNTMISVVQSITLLISAPGFHLLMSARQTETDSYSNFSFDYVSGAVSQITDLGPYASYYSIKIGNDEYYKLDAGLSKNGQPYLTVPSSYVTASLVDNGNIYSLVQVSSANIFSIYQNTTLVVPLYGTNIPIFGVRDGDVYYLVYNESFVTPQNSTVEVYKNGQLFAALDLSSAWDAMPEGYTIDRRIYFSGPLEVSANGVVTAMARPNASNGSHTLYLNCVVSHDGTSMTLSPVEVPSGFEATFGKQAFLNTSGKPVSHVHMFTNTNDQPSAVGYCVAGQTTEIDLSSVIAASTTGGLLRGVYIGDAYLNDVSVFDEATNRLYTAFYAFFGNNYEEAKIFICEDGQVLSVVDLPALYAETYHFSFSRIY